MPSWTLVFGGILIGGIISWALAGRDPGRSSDADATKEPITTPRKASSKNPEKTSGDSSSSGKK
jgi:hypothetical protein